MADISEPKPLHELHERFDRFSDEFFERLRAVWPPESVPENEPKKDEMSKNADDPWPEAIFGSELARHAEQWIVDFLTGRTEAIVLTGYWLQVKAADDKQFPNLLRPLGEAFYRWRSETKSIDDPLGVRLEEVLIQTLNDRARKLELRNSIETVGPGDRFDANRHHPLSGQRGMTVDAVLGWVIMRDERVFAKATVSVK